jgi:probable HAF family extracellular repeat protein
MVNIGSGRLINGYGVSDDGSVVVGTSGTSPGAFRWTQATGMVPLGALAAGQDSYGSAVSSDGSVVIGSAATAGGGQQAFRWTVGTGMRGLGYVPGGGTSYSVATDLSADGSVVVGQGGGLLRAFRWTAAGGIVDLGLLSGYREAAAHAVSADGAVVVGGAFNRDDVPTYRAVIWDAEHGARDLASILTDELGLDLAGWNLRGATGISDDGRVIVGSGVNPQGFEEAWIAELPEPGAIGLVTLVATMLALRRTARAGSAAETERGDPRPGGSCDRRAPRLLADDDVQFDVHVL